jgi:small subunit ribosomal protein S21
MPDAASAQNSCALERQTGKYKVSLRVAVFRPRRLILAEVRLQEGESIENALRRFKRKVQAEDIIKEVKRHSFYLKPGEKLRVKQALARKRAKKKIRKDRDARSDRDK